MQGVTADQAAIKRRAGSSTRGRKLNQPYGHLVLSWPPSQSPTDEEELGAVREALDTIGVSRDCYGVVARHRDTNHAHTHVAFSRIDPSSGIAAKTPAPPPPVRTIQDQPRSPAIGKVDAVVRGQGRDVGGGAAPSRTSKAPTRSSRTEPN